MTARHGPRARRATSGRAEPMGRVLDFLMAVGCFILISALWLAALGMLTSVLMQNLYAFNPLDLPAWKGLQAGFRQGGTIPLGFFLSLAASLGLAGAGEIAILWRLPGIAAAMPSPRLPRLPLPRLRRPKPTPRPAEAIVPPAPPPSPPPLGVAAEARPETSSDPAILARILALFDVWNEPPPAWMAEALRDEIVLLSPDAWPTLESLGSQGLDLLVTLQAHDMLPESPAALRAIGEVETILRAGIAANPGPGAEIGAPPVMTLPASWLCEALDNFLSAQADPGLVPDRLEMARTMLGQALRGMAEADWTSLDRFPEKAGRVRILTDRLREELRPSSPRAAPAPVAMAEGTGPVETIMALLKQLGFTLENIDPTAGRTLLLAQREDLQVLLQPIDLGDECWRLPEGLFGPWEAGAHRLTASPGRQLWQQMARRRLRQPDSRPLAGLLVLHGGRLDREELLAGLITADRRRSGIGLAWLEAGPGALPSLREELDDLREQTLAGRHRERPADHSASPS